MEKIYRRWVCILLGSLAALLALCAAVVYFVDPCLYYRIPEDRSIAFFSERDQGAGLLRNLSADTVMVGSSMVANYRASAIGTACGGDAVCITIPDGSYEEYDVVMDAVFQQQDPERVFFAVDLNILTRDDSGKPDIMPEYLYNDTPLDDVKYLLNKDSLYYSAYALLADAAGTGRTLDDCFVGSSGTWWHHEAALAEYERPAIEAKPLEKDALLESTRKNLQIMERWLTEHSDTDFEIFLSPYSVLYWDKTVRTGQTEAVFAALEETCSVLLTHDNVRLHGLLMDAEIVEDLDRYCDYVHHSEETGVLALEKMLSGEMELTAETMEETLAQWHDFVVNYPYDQFWDPAFWRVWYEARGAA